MINTCYIINDNRVDTNVTFTDKFKSNFNKFIDLQGTEFPVYSNMKWNSHHWTYGYVYNTFLPMIAEELGIDYNINDFLFKENIINDSDLTYAVPKTKNVYSVHLIDQKKFIRGTDSILRKAEVNTYHDVFIGAHSVCQIHNYSQKNNKVLLLNCDSMCVPITPILARYYTYILHLDNRIHTIHNDRINFFTKNNLCDKLTILIAGPGWKMVPAEKRYFDNLQ